MARYVSDDFTQYNDHQLMAFMVDQQGDICSHLDSISAALHRIADNLGAADKRTGEEVLNKIKKALEG